MLLISVRSSFNISPCIIACLGKKQPWKESVKLAVGEKKRKEKKESSRADPHERSPKKTKKKEAPKSQKRDEVPKSTQDWKMKRRKRVQKPKINKSKTLKQNKYAYKNPKRKKIQ